MSAVGVGILAVGVWVIGGQTFRDLMMEIGDSADHAQAMFEASFRDVIVLAVVVAIVAATALGMLLARRLARPLAAVGGAARRIADGDYATRVPRDGPPEVVSLADSFNQMAASLEDGRRLQRDLIANAAHELRTPLTNLSGYLEGLRDGVIPPDPATFDSLLEETERLTRLSLALDDLAVGRPRRPAAAPGGPGPRRRAGGRRGARPARAWTRRASRSSGPGRPALPPARTPTSWPRCSPTCSRTRPATRPPGGRVRVTRASATAEAIVVAVENSGPAIPPDDLPHLFERFYRVEKSRDRERGGAGIGLAIVRQLVEGWGGRVGVTSEDGHTRFWFTLPHA